jgi:hypothetical protein
MTSPDPRIAALLEMFDLPRGSENDLVAAVTALVADHRAAGVEASRANAVDAALARARDQPTAPLRDLSIFVPGHGTVPLSPDEQRAARARCMSFETFAREKAWARFARRPRPTPSGSCGRVDSHARHSKDQTS